jgi:hypothetical protein
MEKCTSCKHWEKVEDDIGECRRHAAEAHRHYLLSPDQEFQLGPWHPGAKWPRTTKLDWCGDYQLKTD